MATFQQSYIVPCTSRLCSSAP